jgi:replicative DNA helicase
MSALEQDNPAEAPVRRDRSRRAGGPGRRTVGEVVAHAMDELHVRQEFGVTGWATGIASLDDRIRQVMAPGRVVCIAGGTKSGKTALAGQIVVAFAAQRVPVLLGSFEDDQPDTMLRYLANLTSGDVGTIRDGFVLLDGRQLPIPDSFDTAP